ncbi:hypothetical protein AVEN_143595-1 [Araneus ventricosus]|uniref:Uncharacterized protein n=1 Tax=Araneus ventricosus TaxID=182803 RepID=A0A4Y2AMZ7_ARAVE|nr:hypothetical protein AVEN_143595-1 [Araneus ventricosus]
MDELPDARATLEAGTTRKVTARRSFSKQESLEPLVKIYLQSKECKKELALSKLCVRKKSFEPSDEFVRVSGAIDIEIIQF